MKCCGVVNADDWRTNVSNPDWTSSSAGTINKPDGCCQWKKDDKVIILFFSIWCQVLFNPVLLKLGGLGGLRGPETSSLHILDKIFANKYYLKAFKIPILGE